MSNFCPDTGGGGGLLFRFTGSVVLPGGRGAADKCHWPVWGALAVFRPHWVCPRSRHVLSPSTLLRLLVTLYGAGPALRAAPVFRSSTKAQPRLGLCLCLPCPSTSGSQELDGCTLPGAVRLIPSVGPASVSPRAGCVRLVSVLGSWPLATTFPVDADHPKSQAVFG